MKELNQKQITRFFLCGWTRKRRLYGTHSDPLDLRSVRDRHEAALMRHRWATRVTIKHPTKP